MMFASLDSRKFILARVPTGFGTASIRHDLSPMSLLPIIKFTIFI